MTSRTIDLPSQLEAFVEQQVASGDYGSAEEVILAGVRRFKAQEEAEAAKMERFLALVQEGIDELDRGEGIEVTDIKAYFAEIRAHVEARAAARAA